MSDLWDQLRRVFAAHAPELSARLRPGADDAAIEVFEATIGTRLPVDWREAYVQHDGCAPSASWAEAQNALGLFGLYRWLPLAESLKLWQHHVDSFEADIAYTCDDHGGAWDQWAILPWTVPPPQWIPIAERTNPTMCLYADLLPGPKGHPGQIVGEDVHGPAIWLESTGLTEYLAGLANGLERGELVASRDAETGRRFWANATGSPYRATGYDFTPYQPNE